MKSIHLSLGPSLVLGLVLATAGCPLTTQDGPRPEPGGAGAAGDPSSGGRSGETNGDAGALIGGNRADDTSSGGADGGGRTRGGDPGGAGGGQTHGGGAGGADGGGHGNSQLLCGDGKVASGEQCDDGDLVSGDGCSAECTLEAGYTCSGAGPSVCVDVDECHEGLADCATDAYCVNNVGYYQCVCRSGFAGNGFTCTDIDECAEGLAACSTHGTCMNIPGTYGCACLPGYAGDGFTCTDIDECATTPFVCQPGETCIDMPGFHLCQPSPCEPPTVNCGGACVNPLSDEGHCGDCHSPCAPDQECTAGVCTGKDNPG